MVGAMDTTTLLPCLAALLVACAQTPSAGDPTQSAGDPTQSEVLLSGAADGWRAALVHDNGDVGIWTCAALPVFPQYATPEAVGLDDRGRCHVFVTYSGKWTPLTVLSDGAWLGGLTHGDLDPRQPGAELYTGGKLGRLYEVRAHANGVLDGLLIGEVPGMEIHTMKIADWRGMGDELLVFTRPGHLYRGSFDGDARFMLEDLGDLPGRMRDAVVLPALGGGPRLATVSRDGALRLLEFHDGEPSWTELHRLPMGRGRITARVSEGAIRGTVIYTTADDGRVFRHVEAADGNWSHETIYRGPQGPRGLVAGRFDPDPEVETVAVFGYSKDVTLLRRGADGGWTEELLFTDRDKGHWLAVGEFDGRNDTDELLLSGYGARLVMLARDVE